VLIYPLRASNCAINVPPTFRRNFGNFRLMATVVLATARIETWHFRSPAKNTTACLDYHYESRRGAGRKVVMPSVVRATDRGSTESLG
jgi:hypothetical protein